MRESKIFVLFLPCLNDMSSLPENWPFFIFLSSLSLWTWHYFQRVLIWRHILKYIMKQIGLEGCLKKHRHVFKTMATAVMELFVTLVSSFQPLTNFTKNSNIGAMGVVNASNEYYNIILILYYEICAGDGIKYCITVPCNLSKDNLFHRLMNYLNSSNDGIWVSYSIS